MGKIMRTYTRILIILSILLMSLPAWGQSSVSKDINIQPGHESDRDVSSVSGDVTIGKNARINGNISTVSGDVDIAVRARVGNINSVSGDLNLGKGVKAESCETVSGDILLYEGCEIDGAVESVSGDITAAGNCEIKGLISTVSGDVELDDTRLRGDIKTVSGDIALFNGSVVEGDIFINRKNDFMSGNLSKVKVVIDMNSVVKGSIRVKEKDTNVVVILSNGGKVRGEIINAEVRKQ